MAPDSARSIPSESDAPRKARLSLYLEPGVLKRLRMARGRTGLAQSLIVEHAVRHAAGRVSGTIPTRPRGRAVAGKNALSQLTVYLTPETAEVLREASGALKVSQGAFVENALRVFLADEGLLRDTVRGQRPDPAALPPPEQPTASPSERRPRASGDALGRYLKRRREASCRTLRQVSEDSAEAISVGHLSRVERGDFVPTVDGLLALARTYGVPLERLLLPVQMDRLSSLYDVDEEATPDELLETGLEAMNGDSFLQAAVVYEAALERLSERPDGPRARRLRGRLLIHCGAALRRLGAYRPAEMYIQECLALGSDPESDMEQLVPYALYTLARIHLDLGMYPIAMAEAKEAVDRAGAKSHIGAVSIAFQGHVLLTEADEHEDPSAQRKMWKRAEGLYEKALSILREKKPKKHSEKKKLEADANSYESALATCQVRLGKEEGLQRHGRLIKTARRWATDREQARLRLDFAVSLRRAGETRAAYDRLLEAKNSKGCRGNRHLEFIAEFHLWESCLDLGRTGEADRRVRRLCKLREGMDIPTPEIREFDRALARLGIPNRIKSGAPGDGPWAWTAHGTHLPPKK